MQTACGGHHSLFLTRSGKILACGSNAYGQIAQKRLKNFADLRYLKCFFNKNVQKIACGWNHTLVLVEPHIVYSVGLNKYGELGVMNFEMKKRFTVIESLIGKKVIDIFAGGYHSWFLLDFNETIVDFNPPSVLADSESNSISETDSYMAKGNKEQSRKRIDNSQRRSFLADADKKSKNSSQELKPENNVEKNKLRIFLENEEKTFKTRSLIGKSASPSNSVNRQKISKVSSFTQNLKNSGRDFQMIDQNLLDIDFNEKDRKMYDRSNKEPIQTSKRATIEIQDDEENLLRNSSKYLKNVFLDAIQSSESRPEQASRESQEQKIKNINYSQNNNKNKSIQNEQKEKESKNLKETGILKTFGNNSYEGSFDNLQNSSIVKNLPNILQEKDKINVQTKNQEKLQDYDDFAMLNFKMRSAVNKRIDKIEEEKKNLNIPNQSVETVFSIHSPKRKKIENVDQIKDVKPRINSSFEPSSNPTIKPKKEESFKESKTTPAPIRIAQKRQSDEQIVHEISSHLMTNEFRHENHLEEEDFNQDFYLLFAQLEYCHRFAIIFSDRAKKDKLTDKVNKCIESLKRDDPKIAICSFVTSEEFSQKKTNSVVEKLLIKNDLTTHNSHILMMIASCEKIDKSNTPLPQTDYDHYDRQHTEIGDIFSLSESDVIRDKRLLALSKWYLTLKKSLKNEVQDIQFVELRSFKYQ